MKTIYKISALVILLIASGICCYRSIKEWNNQLLAYSCLLFFAVFWACIIYLTSHNRIIDTYSQEIEDQEYTPDNVNYDK